MEPWILVAAVGGALALAGWGVQLRRYRQGKVSARGLLSLTVGLLSFGAYGVVSSIAPAFASGPVALILLLPAFAAIVVWIRDHQRASG